jgi:hypothetical protein
MRPSFARPTSNAAFLLVLAASLAACARAPVPEPAPDVDRRLPAPWSDPALAAQAVPALYLEVWQRAENRARCALLAPARIDPALQQRATTRAATFSGGWAVAYDLPETRSAFGIAGSGANAWDPGVYDGWPNKREFADGSRVGYGPEDASETNWLAYVRIPGQQCLYNVWSRRGQAHLEELLGQLRFVSSP